VHLKADLKPASATVPKLKPTCQREIKNSCSPWSQSGRWKGRRTTKEKICGKDEFWAWSGREKE